MNIYLISDTHFNHNIQMIKYCDRPANYEELILENVKKLPKDSLLIHLGDVSLGNDKYWHIRFTNSVKCRKILVRGNHDGHSNNWYYDKGWDFVCRRFVDKIFKKKILFSHIPQEYNGEYDLNFHGHFHNSKHHEQELRSIKNDKQRLIALEYSKFKPIKITHKLLNQ